MWDPNDSTSGPQGGSGTWNASRTSWWNGTNNISHASTNDAQFGGTAGTVTLGASLAINSLIFEVTSYVIDTSSRTLTVTDGVDGSVDWAKRGNGTISASGSGHFSGTARIQEGTLQLNSSNALGQGEIVMSGGTTLNLRNDFDTIFSQHVTVSGSVTINANRSGASANGRTLATSSLTVSNNATANITAGNNYRYDPGQLTLGSASTLSLPDDLGVFITGDYLDTTNSVLRIGDSDSGTLNSNVFHDGLHFANGRTSVVHAAIVPQHHTNTDPVLGAKGPGTVVYLLGPWDGDGSNADNWLVVQDGGRIVVGSSATLDSTHDGSGNGQPLRLRGDGTGTVEFEPGFDASPTDDTSLDSVSIQNVNFITSSSQNLPGTILFDVLPGGTWTVQHSDQVFAGDLIVDVDANLHTESALTVSNLELNADLSKHGTNSLTIAGGSIAAGTTLNVEEGEVRYNMNDPDLTVNVSSGATFGGSGSLGTLNIHGLLDPGLDTSDVLNLSATSIVFSSTATLRLQLNGLAAATEYDQVVANGQITLDAPQLSLRLGFATVHSDSFVIVLNNGSAPVAGTFFGLAEGATVATTYNGQIHNLRISYQGGDGNDIVLTTVPEPGTLTLLALGVAVWLTRRQRMYRERRRKSSVVQRRRVA